MKEGDVSREHVIDFSKSIYDEAQRLITRVNDIIKISEIDEQGISYENEAVNAGTTVTLAFPKCNVSNKFLRIGNCL